MSVLTEGQNTVTQSIFTCISCSVGFITAEDQRVHYWSDHHRYNMKRRIASLPPVSASVFNEKVLTRRAETAVTTSPKGATCEICGKTYSTENAYRSHLLSRKHKETELKIQKIPRLDSSRKEELDISEEAPGSEKFTTPSQLDASKHLAVSLDSKTEGDRGKGVEGGGGGGGGEVEVEVEEVDDSIDAKITASRRALASNSCLFCPHRSSSLEHSLEHMSQRHSFFIPDVEYLRDTEGLLSYLAEKVAINNICLFCNSTSREFRTVDAVWKHMTDKSHCKVAYDTLKDRLEISDFYDFSSSYPETAKRIPKNRKNMGAVVLQESGQNGDDDDDDDDDDGWEDVDDDVEGLTHTSNAESATSEEGLPQSQITYGDTEYELVLPSGERIGHRSLRRYYAQSFSSYRPYAEDPNSGAAIVRRLLTNKRSDLIPVKGGFGAFGSGTEIIKARNRGEAREAGRHIREFRDQKRKEDYKTRVAFVHNHQKHYRDPLLQ